MNVICDNPQCGNTYTEQSEMCPYCGTPNPRIKEKNKIEKAEEAKSFVSNSRLDLLSLVENTGASKAIEEKPNDNMIKPGPIQEKRKSSKKVWFIIILAIVIGVFVLINSAEDDSANTSTHKGATTTSTTKEMTESSTSQAALSEEELKYMSIMEVLMKRNFTLLDIFFFNELESAGPVNNYLQRVSDVRFTTYEKLVSYIESTFTGYFENPTSCDGYVFSEFLNPCKYMLEDGTGYLCKNVNPMYDQNFYISQFREKGYDYSQGYDFEQWDAMKIELISYTSTECRFKAISSSGKQVEGHAVFESENTWDSETEKWVLTELVY